MVRSCVPQECDVQPDIFGSFLALISVYSSYRKSVTLQPGDGTRASKNYSAGSLGTLEYQEMT